jgi:DNA-binding response OmpR family regulator
MPVPPLASRRQTYSRALRLRPESLKVFICDDDLDFATELASALTTCGFETRTLLDGKTPIEIFELFAPDIVLLDLYMPPPDGFEMMNHIVQNVSHRNISLAIMSGGDAGVLETADRFCAARGIVASAVLQKPIYLGEVLQVCNAHRRRRIGETK